MAPDWQCIAKWAVSATHEIHVVRALNLNPSPPVLQIYLCPPQPCSSDRTMLLETDYVLLAGLLGWQLG